MGKKSYYELLKDPRWQMKRLEILQRSGFKCECCGSKENTLHIHHGYYEKNLKPWEYNENTLHCFCKECHEINEHIKQIIYKEIASIPFNATQILGYIKGLKHDNLIKKVQFFSYEEVLGYVHALGMNLKSIDMIIKSINKSDSSIELWKIQMIKDSFKIKKLNAKKKNN